ncbi:MAG: GWxTD domain-containing protein [Balneolaceae bacterium]|nr:GWxTD domain-containing protein [Balneolaceae bacterium]
MRTLTRITVVTLICCVAGVTHSAGEGSGSTDYYDRGLEARQQGDIQKALSIWEQARQNLNDPAKVDSRIGFSYIESATEHQLHEHYEKASSMYFWSLTTSDLDKNYDAIDEELKRIQPLLESYKYRQLNRLLKNRDPGVVHEIKGFWIKNDPTPGETYNERLLEHWERIAYSRDHFTENKVTVYGTDDRAKIFIKYGPPDYVKEGTLKFSLSDVKSWARELTRLSTQRKSSLFSSSTQNSTSSGGASSGSSDFGNSNIFQTEAVSDRISRHVRQYFLNPRYSIWVYRGINKSPVDNVIYIFGDSGDGGRYGLRRSVEDFIPKRAFRPINRLGSTGVTPAILLQLMIYDELSIADPFFGDAFRNLESSLFQIYNAASADLAFRQRTQSEFMLAEFKATAPNNISLYEKLVPALEVDFQQYRMLDDNNNPYLLIYICSYPQEAFITSSAIDLSSTNSIDNYLLTFTAQVRDDQYNLIDETEVSPDFSDKYYNIYDSKQDQAVGSLIRVPFIAENTYQSLSATLENRDVERNIGSNTYPTTLKGMGKVNITQPHALTTDESVLEMGDVILGYQTDGNGAGENIPFRIDADNEIPMGKNLMTHIEVYHLQLAAGESGRFQLEYKVRSKSSGNIITSLFSGNDGGDVSLTLNFETLESTFREDIEIETQKLEEGDYLLELRAIDLVSNSEVSRRVEFSVVE